MLHVMQPGEVPSAVVYFHEWLFALTAVVGHHLAMATQPARKCRCASDTHGHKAGDCTNLITLPELSLCKPCFDKSLEELNDMGGPERGKVRKEGQLKHRRA